MPYVTLRKNGTAVLNPQGGWSIAYQRMPANMAHVSDYISGCLEDAQGEPARVSVIGNMLLFNRSDVPDMDDILPKRLRAGRK